MINNDISKKVKDAKNPSELKAYFDSVNMPLSEEEAKHYFDFFCKKGKINDDELSNVSAGSFCKNGKSYSSDKPHYLITTLGNKCRLYKEASRSCWSPGGIKGLCSSCSHCEDYREHEGLHNYCRARTADNDPCA